jgi:hypothetical protein
MIVPTMKRAQGGLSLIEMMVAVTIAMIGSLVMFQSMTSGERYKRVTASGNDSQQSAMIAFDQLSYMGRNAGAGLVQTPGSFNCLLQALMVVRAFIQVVPPCPRRLARSAGR